ncbi:MAG: motility protein A [Brevinemataceae bacterium]
MERGSIIGLVVCALLMFGGMFISAGSLAPYWDLTSILITIGGSVGATMLANPWERSTKLVFLMSLVFKNPQQELGALIDTLLTFGEKARKEGVLSLEDHVSEIPDPFLKKAIRLVVDGTDPEVVKRIMYNEINKLDERHGHYIKVFEDWGSFAPAFGMIGTLVGLIALLGNLSDTASLGRGMAVALITTLYGSILANWICIPMAAKLHAYNADEVLMKEIILEGVLSIQAGDNPAILRERLNSFLGVNEKRGENLDE